VPSVLGVRSSRIRAILQISVPTRKGKGKGRRGMPESLALSESSPVELGALMHLACMR
jgi:hypothetical protein